MRPASPLSPGVFFIYRSSPMIQSLMNRIRPGHRSSAACTIWYSIISRTSRQGSSGSVVSSCRKQVLKFNSDGGLFVDTVTSWRPFEPSGRDRVETELTMFDGFVLVSKISLDHIACQAIEQYGLMQFLLEAAACRSYEPALSRITGPRSPAQAA